MEKYKPKELEAKWQKTWQESGAFKDYSREKKYYVLDMFPYPSGVGLHVGHPKGYIATDVLSRYKYLSGCSVLHPMGWDAFGLPAENYALKNNVHPRVAVEENIATFKEQLGRFGFTYDWEREISTVDPDYYRWTQWIFLQLFKKGLAYQSDEPVNWCPTCKTVLANEDLENGLCERCDTQVVQKRMRQWVLRMTAYADRLLQDLDSKELLWNDSIIEQQRNWIGRSEGVEFRLPLARREESIEVFTTRIDTVYGMTYAVLAPEHPLVASLKERCENQAQIEEYIIAAQNKTELERTELQKEKSGVLLQGVKAINPFTSEEIPLYVADYVLASYGTGAVMAVPAHDERDYEFARRYELPIKPVIEPVKIEGTDIPVADCFTDDGILTASGEYTGLASAEAREKLAAWLTSQGLGQKRVNYRMRDWVFSRQRYWGEPIPIVHCPLCGAVPLPESELPLRLPEVANYQPTGTGEGPLAAIEDWVNTTCPTCGGPAKRETNTMPQWAGSSWYYLRYIDPKNDQALIDPSLEKEWMPVDQYVGGAEHATRHLLYARFWHKFLYDIGVVSTIEPFKRYTYLGLILAEDGRKMSKRWNNVINPNDVIDEFGADAMRLYEMFMGPFLQAIAWSTDGVKGVRRFLDRVWKMADNLTVADTPEIETLLHKTIKKVGADIEDFRFNTAVSAMMTLVNAAEKSGLSQASYEALLRILSPFAPHITEDLWERLGHEKSIFLSAWPEFDAKKIIDKEVNLVVQVNGKVRETFRVAADISEEEAKAMALGSERIQRLLSGRSVKNIIFVPGKLISIVF
jgi:leucyl-tRNA synthetase